MNSPDFKVTGRLSDLEIKNSHNIIKLIPFLTKILDELPFILGILNEHRQFIYFNKKRFHDLSYEDENLQLGMRPGEVLGCVHSKDSPEGCGEGRHCNFCGVLRTFLRAQKEQNSVTNESRLSVKQGNHYKGLDIEITVTPISNKDENYYILSMIDKSQEKMRNFLEKAFFHDTINIISGLRGVLQLLSQSSDQQEDQSILLTSVSAVSHLLDTINQYQTLLQVESDQVVLDFRWFEPYFFMINLVKRASGLDIDKQIEIKVNLEKSKKPIYSDQTLLDRVLFNMLKNAIEASKFKGKVEFNYLKDDKYIFQVRNQGVIPEDIQMQIFQRSFSTKGIGRGVGTYSMKVITEKYLNGQIYFRSNEKEGTLFICELPLAEKY